MAPKFFISPNVSVTSANDDVTSAAGEIIFTTVFASFVAKSVPSTVVNEVENRVFVASTLVKMISPNVEATFSLGEIISPNAEATFSLGEMADFYLNNIPSCITVKTASAEAPFSTIKIAPMLVEMVSAIGVSRVRIRGAN